MLGAACGGCAFGALTAPRMGRRTATETEREAVATGLTATALTASRFAFGATETAETGERTTLGAGDNGKDKDNDGEPKERPEFRRGREEFTGRPADGPTGVAGELLALITCAKVAFGVNANNTAKNDDAARLIPYRVRPMRSAVMSH